MKFRFTCFVLALLSLITWGVDSALGQEDKKVLTIWLIPLELAATDQTMDFDKFNEKVSEGGWVTVLNTTVGHYRAQLIAWNPEFAFPNFPIIKGQEETLKALRRFAEQNQAHINVRFVWWGQAFDELRAIFEGKQSPILDGVQIAPDVAQVGSTWVGYFAKKQALIPRDSTPDRLSWRDAPDATHASLRYTTDVRLIFYWKRMAYPVSGPAFVLDSASWDTILSSLGKRPIEPGRLSPPMAMPIALTANLLHDYMPLVWAGGGRFISLGSNKADLTSDSALAVPRKLMERATQPGEQNSRHRILAFPEMSHEEAVHHFFNGEYLALIEPVSFIKRWKDMIARNGLPVGFSQDQKRNPAPGSVSFWDYAGVAAPPRTFIGGSDLIVTSRVKGKSEERDLAFKLARFLALDERYSAKLAELGTLPAQQQKLGVDVLAASLKDEPNSSSQGGNQADITDFAVALSLALSRRNEQEYPALAEWPDYVESREVLEAIQRIWRRIGEGKEGEEDVANLKEAAAEAQLAINRHLNWWTKLWQDIRRWWWVIVIGLSAFLAIAINHIRLQRIAGRRQKETIRALEQATQAEKEKLLALETADASQREKIQALELAGQAEKERRQALEIASHQLHDKVQALERAAQAEKGRLLALRLYRAKVHEQLHAYGAKLIDLAESRSDNLRATLTEYGSHISTIFNHHLAATTKAVASEVAVEMEGYHEPKDMRKIVDDAYRGAEIEFKAAWARHAPAVSLILNPDLEQWRLSRLPNLLIVVLQEWFYNCLKEIEARSPHQPTIEARVDEDYQATVLRIVSPLPIAEANSVIFEQDASLSSEESGHGIPLIRDILWYGFEVKASCQTQPDGRTILSIPILFARSSK
jgi:hypothetical protein